MARNLVQMGEAVSIEFESADASTAALVTLKDANLVTRTLQLYERLIVDTLEANVASAAGTVDVFADIDGDGAVDPNELIATFNAGSVTIFSGGPSGFSIPLALTPKVLAAAGGAIEISGTGRIVAQTQGQRPSWQCSQVARGL